MARFSCNDIKKAIFVAISQTSKLACGSVDKFIKKIVLNLLAKVYLFFGLIVNKCGRTLSIQMFISNLKHAFP